MLLTSKITFYIYIKAFICVTRNVYCFVYEEVWLGPLYSIYIFLNIEYIFALRKYLLNNIFSFEILLPFPNTFLAFPATKEFSLTYKFD